MEHLTADQITLLVTAATLFGGFLGWLGRGFGFLATRWWTNAPAHDRAAHLNTVADLGAKLRAHGMTMDEIRQLEEIVRSPSVSSSQAATSVVVKLVEEGDEPETFQSNIAMKARTGAAYAVADAKLEQALMDLQLLISDVEWECVLEAQRHWKAYRTALENYALREYEGGTHATLAMALVGLAETERRTEEIRSQVQERAAR